MSCIRICVLLCFYLVSNAQITPEIYSWKLNDGEIGSYYVSGNATPISNGLDANVEQVQYSAGNVYVSSSGVPDYPVGPFLDGNPSAAGGQDYLFRIPRNPQENTGTKTATRLGHIGVLINGVPIYNALDAMSYNNLGIWHRNAVVMENTGFDCAKGHPAPNMQSLGDGLYHHHQNPASFSHSTNPPSNVCDQYPSTGLYIPDSTQHSPLIGFAFDGFPVYGAYGYTDANDALTGIRRMRTSYQKRNITDRTTLPDGSVLNTGEYGPAISASFPLGSFIEDYGFVPGSGDLDTFNGRFCVTPEYPAGTYAYFATMDADGNSEYPYLIGPNYFGVVATDNFPSGPGGGTSVTITEAVTTWDGTIPTHAHVQVNVTSKLYPNPAEHAIRISSSEVLTGEKYFIYNALGKEISDGTFNGNQIEIASLPQGIYFLVTLKNGTSRQFKFVKE